MHCWFVSLSIFGLVCAVANTMVTPATANADLTIIRNTVATCPVLDEIILVNSSSVPFYHLVYYFTRETMHKEPQVYDLNIAYFLYYTHMYFAWMQVEPSLSVVAVRKDPKKSDLYGANMALRIQSLSSMYAPGNITKVLKFVRHCYEHIRRTHYLQESKDSFVSTLRTAASIDINKNLIMETMNRFKNMVKPGSYHLLWENKTLMDAFLTRIGYSRVLCGGPQSPSDVCDWSRLGVSSEKAQDLCVYLLVKKES